jgi:hypothetical protein
MGAAARADRISEIFAAVNLREEFLDRYPHEFSGGQAQRIGIARALAADARILILDEPVSALDVSVQAQVLNLLADLKAKFGLTYLFISHDLAVVEAVSDRVAVLYFGAVVEVGPAAEIFANPRHPYTKLLADSAPVVGRALKAPEGRETELARSVEPAHGLRLPRQLPPRGGQMRAGGSDADRRVGRDAGRLLQPRDLRRAPAPPCSRPGFREPPKISAEFALHPPCFGAKPPVAGASPSGLCSHLRNLRESDHGSGAIRAAAPCVDARTCVGAFSPCPIRSVPRWRTRSRLS